MAEDPATLEGYGPISPRTARTLAADRRWRLWLTDATGAIGGVSTSTDAPLPALARLIRARDPFCRYPGCRRAAGNCDLDHAVPHPVGATSRENVGPLCRRHHRMKTAGTDRLTVSEGGHTVTGTSGNGITSRDHAPSLL